MEYIFSLAGVVVCRDSDNCCSAKFPLQLNKDYTKTIITRVLLVKSYF